MHPRELLAQYNAELHLPESFEQAALHSPEGWAEFVINYLHENNDLSQEKLERYLSYTQETSPQKRSQQEELWRLFQEGGMSKAPWVGWNTTPERGAGSDSIYETTSHWFLLDYLNTLFYKYQPTTPFKNQSHPELLWRKHYQSLWDYLARDKKPEDQVLCQELIPILDEWKKEEWFQLEFAMLILTCAYWLEKEHRNLFAIFKHTITLTKENPKFVSAFKDIIIFLTDESNSRSFNNICCEGQKIRALLVSYLSLVENKGKNTELYYIILNNYDFFDKFEPNVMQVMLALESQGIACVSLMVQEKFHPYTRDLADAFKTLYKNQGLCEKNILFLLNFDALTLVPYIAKLQIIFCSSDNFSEEPVLEDLRQYYNADTSASLLYNWIDSLAFLKDNGVSIEELRLLRLSDLEYTFYPFIARINILKSRSSEEEQNKYQSVLDDFLGENPLEPEDGMYLNLEKRISIITKLIDILTTNKIFNSEHLKNLLYLFFKPNFLFLCEEIMMNEVFTVWDTDPSKAEFIRILFDSLLDLTQEESVLDLISLLKSLPLPQAQVNAAPFQNPVALGPRGVCATEDRNSRELFAIFLMMYLQELQEFNMENIQYIFINLLITFIAKRGDFKDNFPKIPLSLPDLKQYFTGHPELSLEIQQTTNQLLTWLHSIDFLSPAIKARLFHARAILRNNNINQEHLMRLVQQRPGLLNPINANNIARGIQQYLRQPNPFVFLPQVENILYILKFLHQNNLLNKNRYGAILNLNPNIIINYGDLKIFLEHLIPAIPEFSVDTALMDIFIQHSTKLSKELAETFNNLILNKIFSEKLLARIMQVITDFSREKIQQLSQALLLILNQQNLMDEPIFSESSSHSDIELLANHQKLRDLLKTKNIPLTTPLINTIFSYSTDLYCILSRFHRSEEQWLFRFLQRLIMPTVLPYLPELASFLTQIDSLSQTDRNQRFPIMDFFPAISHVLNTNSALRNALNLGLSLEDLFFYYLNYQHSLLPLTSSNLFEKNRIVNNIPLPILIITNQYLIKLGEEIYKQFIYDYSEAHYFIVAFYNLFTKTITYSTTLALSTADYLSTLFRIFIKYDFPLAGLSLAQLSDFSDGQVFKKPFLQLFELLPFEEKNIDVFNQFFRNFNYFSEVFSFQKAAHSLSKITPFSLTTIKFLKTYKDNVWKVDYFLKQLTYLSEEKLISLCQRHLEIAKDILKFIRPLYPIQADITAENLAQELRMHFPLKTEKPLKRLYSKNQLEKMFLTPAGQLDDIKRKFNSILYGDLNPNEFHPGPYDEDFYIVLEAYWLRAFQFADQQLTDEYNTTCSLSDISKINKKILQLLQAYQVIRAADISGLVDSRSVYLKGLLAFLERKQLNSLALKIYMLYVFDMLHIRDDMSAFIIKVLLESEIELLNTFEYTQLCLELYFFSSTESQSSLCLSQAILFFIQHYHSKEIFQAYDQKRSNLEEAKEIFCKNIFLPTSKGYRDTAAKFSEVLPENLRIDAGRDNVETSTPATESNLYTFSRLKPFLDKLLINLQTAEKHAGLHVSEKINVLIENEFSFDPLFHEKDIESSVEDISHRKVENNLENTILSCIDNFLTQNQTTDTEIIPPKNNVKIKLNPYHSIFSANTARDLQIKQVGLLHSAAFDSDNFLFNGEVLIQHQEKHMSSSARRGNWQPEQEMQVFSLGKRQRSDFLSSADNQEEASCSSPPAKRKKPSSGVEEQSCSSTSFSKGKGPMRGY